MSEVAITITPWDYKLVTDEWAAIVRGETPGSALPGWVEMNDHERRVYLVARQFQVVGRLLNAFNHGDEQYLSRTVHEMVLEAERVFSVAVDLDHSGKEEERASAAAEYDRAEHLVRVVARLVEWEAPQYAADPEAWVEKWRGLPVGWQVVDYRILAARKKAQRARHAR